MDCLSKKNGTVDFYLNWTDYVHDFGNSSREYWVVLSELHRLANGSVSTKLQVDMRDKKYNKRYSSQCAFYTNGSITGYTLHVSSHEPHNTQYRRAKVWP